MNSIVPVSLWQKVVWLLGILALICPNVDADPVKMFGGMQPEDWAFHLGREFPGATGGLEFVEADRSLICRFDFTEGGQYVAINCKRNLPVSFDVLKLHIKVNQPTGITYRLVDASGRTFQSHGKRFEPGKTQVRLIDPKGPWKTAFGGPKDANRKTKPQLPFRRLSIVLGLSRDLEPRKGEVVISGISAEVDQSLIIPAKYESVDCELAGWRISGQWDDAWPSATLKATASPVSSQAGDAQLSITLPQMARYDVKRYQLQQGKTFTFEYSPPINQINPRNRYQLTFKVQTPKQSAQQTVAIHGGLVDKINLGKPKSSDQITYLPFGSCAHFSKGMKQPNGAFGIWANYERLLDQMQQCGLKWLRSYVSLEHHEDGTVDVDDDAMAWLKAAKKRGIRVIGMIGMNAKNSPEKLHEIARKSVLQTQGLVDVYELGNEPQNGGGWIQKYGGTWNGKGKDNEASPWVVEHLKATNLMADAIHAVAPDAKIIGVGAAPPTNFRYLNKGLSKWVTGVVEHPYPFALPPEKMPFGTNTAKRDGIHVGDDDHTFEGLIRSYIDKFKSTGQMREIWVTEFGYPTFWFNGKNRKNLYAGYTEYAQAVYLTRRFMHSLALPIAVSCQYDLIDDFGSGPYYNEANFGLLRSDWSRKPSYHAVQRMNSLLAECVLDKSSSVKITYDQLHRSQFRGTLIRNWDGESIQASNGVAAYVFANPTLRNEKVLALWSMQPVGGEFNNRVVSLSIDGCVDFDQAPVAINLISGETFDLPIQKDGDKISFEHISLTGDPLLIKLFK